MDHVRSGRRGTVAQILRGSGDRTARRQRKKSMARAPEPAQLLYAATCSSDDQWKSRRFHALSRSQGRINQHGIGTFPGRTIARIVAEPPHRQRATAMLMRGVAARAVHRTRLMHQAVTRLHLPRQESILIALGID